MTAGEARALLALVGMGDMLDMAETAHGRGTARAVMERFRELREYEVKEITNLIEHDEPERTAWEAAHMAYNEVRKNMSDDLFATAYSEIVGGQG